MSASFSIDPSIPTLLVIASSNYDVAKSRLAKGFVLGIVTPKRHLDGYRVVVNPSRLEWVSLTYRHYVKFDLNEAVFAYLKKLTELGNEQKAAAMRGDIDEILKLQTQLNNYTDHYANLLRLSLSI